MIQKLLEYNTRISVYQRFIEDMDEARSMQSLKRKYKNYITRDKKMAKDLKRKFENEFLKDKQE